MKQTAIIFLSLLLFVGTTKSQNIDPIFNGQDLSNWVPVLRSEANADTVFYVKDGIMNAGGAPFGYIRTKDSYENYELSLEWRWTGEPTNSGVLLAITGEDKVWPHCIEAQLKHENAGDLVLMHEGARASVQGQDYQVDPEVRWVSVANKFNPSAEKTPGEWNSYRIRFLNGTLEFWINDTLQMKATNVTPTNGPIGFQSEGSHIQFRNIELIQL
jgi:hypothetical protein